MHFQALSRSVRFAAALLLAAWAGVASAEAQGVVRATYGDWQMRCESVQGAGDQCALVQNVVTEDKGNLGLVVIVVKTADGSGLLLRVVAPLNILLPNGLGLRIDRTEIGRAGFVRCLTTGCVAEVVMDAQLLAQFRSGRSATFIVWPTPDEGVGIPVALTGFSAGVAALP
jgi:invasion protein IalB